MHTDTPPGMPGLTLERYLLETQRSRPDATGEFTGLFHQISLAAKVIHSRVNRAGLSGVLGTTGKVNVQGEVVAKLDDFANNALVRAVDAGGHVCAMASEEVEEVIPARADCASSGKYVLLFDPLDGSGNIDINATIGTIFSVHERVTTDGPGRLEDCLQQGSKQVAAGYVIYGSSCVLVYTDGKQVSGFTFDPQIGEFFLSHPDIKLPSRGDTYSINEGNRSKWTDEVRGWVDWIKSTDNAIGKPYGLRYIGAVVADFHRTLLRGGIFAYPGDVKRAEGKLRLLYECSPLAFIAETAGGAASSGTGPILDIVPTKLHERTPLFIGSRDDVQDALKFINK